MTLREIAAQMATHPEYFYQSEADIVVGFKPKRVHKKKRIQKKWTKRYGVMPVYKTKKCRRLDVSLDTLIDFCYEQNLPLPDEILSNTIQNDGD